MNEMTAETAAMPTVELDAQEAGFGRRAVAQLRRVGVDLAYLGAMLGTSVLAFCVWVGTLSATLSLIVFVVGVAVWYGSVYLFRWTAWIDRKLAGWVRGEEIDAVYRGMALDPEAVSQLLGGSEEGRLAELSPREREVLELTAEGRSNSGSPAAWRSATGRSRSTSQTSSGSSTCR